MYNIKHILTPYTMEISVLRSDAMYVSEKPVAAIFRVDLKVVAAGSSKTWVSSYQTTRSHIPEDRNLHIYSRKDLTSNRKTQGLSIRKIKHFLYDSKLQNLCFEDKTIALTRGDLFPYFNPHNSRQLLCALPYLRSIIILSSHLRLYLPSGHITFKFSS
jgi:hypothetical protein